MVDPASACAAALQALPSRAAQISSEKPWGFPHDLLQQPQAPLLSPGQLRIFGKFELLLLVCTS
jgi:hypothetical protein